MFEKWNRELFLDNKTKKGSQENKKKEIDNAAFFI